MEWSVSRVATMHIRLAVAMDLRLMFSHSPSLRSSGQPADTIRTLCRPVPHGGGLLFRRLVELVFAVSLRVEPPHVHERDWFSHGLVACMGRLYGWGYGNISIPGQGPQSWLFCPIICAHCQSSWSGGEHLSGPNARDVRSTIHTGIVRVLVGTPLPLILYPRPAWRIASCRGSQPIREHADCDFRLHSQVSIPECWSVFRAGGNTER